jgi:putative membrane protein
MKWLSRVIVAVLLNALGLWVAANYIPGFRLVADAKEIAIIAAILTVLNFVLKPILTLVLGPVIVLTLGLGILFVNALVLYVLDIFVQNLRIETVLALIYATFLFSIINFVFHSATKSRS